MESGGRSCVGVYACGRNLASVAVKMFLLLIYYIDTSYKLYTFSAICSDSKSM